MSLKKPLLCSENGQSKPVYVLPKDLSKYSPLQSSLQKLNVDSKGLRDRYHMCFSISFLMYLEMEALKDKLENDLFLKTVLKNSFIAALCSKFCEEYIH